MIAEPMTDDFSIEGHKVVRVARNWGNFIVLQEYPGVKVKELLVEPGQSLSLQRHFHRAEFWIVVDGNGMLELDNKKLELKPQTTVTIKPLQWHKLWNTSNRLLRLVEIQYGSECDEADIERKT
jgi:mannose-6-phosphate isomerase-like protein (cupin superfamily)